MSKAFGLTLVPARPSISRRPTLLGTDAALEHGAANAVGPDCDLRSAHTDRDRRISLRPLRPCRHELLHGPWYVVACSTWCRSCSAVLLSVARRHDDARPIRGWSGHRRKSRCSVVDQCAWSPRECSKISPRRPSRATGAARMMIHQPTASAVTNNAQPMPRSRGHQLHGEKAP